MIPCINMHWRDTLSYYRNGIFDLSETNMSLDVAVERKITKMNKRNKRMDKENKPNSSITSFGQDQPVV